VSGGAASWVRTPPSCLSKTTSAASMWKWTWRFNLPPNLRGKDTAPVSAPSTSASRLVVRAISSAKSEQIGLNDNPIPVPFPWSRAAKDESP
jgi:hypothetical protein